MQEGIPLEWKEEAVRQAPPQVQQKMWKEC
jgi:hypothetical protein